MWQVSGSRSWTAASGEAFLGLSQATTAADMAQSVLEGVAFSIRQGLELFDHPASKITLIGGGARSDGARS